MRVGEIDVDVVEQVVTHEEVIALRVIMVEAAVLVQVVGADLGEIAVPVLAGLNEVLVGADGRGAGGEAEHAVRLQDDLSGDDVRRFAAHVLVILGVNDLHGASLL